MHFLPAYLSEVYEYHIDLSSLDNFDLSEWESEEKKFDQLQRQESKSKKDQSGENR